MTNMGVWAVLAVLLLFTATVKAGEAKVTFWRKTFKMHCPSNGTWYDKANNKLGMAEQLEYEYDNSKKGLYICDYEDSQGDFIKYYFYVQGKVCENCFELDGVVFFVAIVLDMVMTGLLMVIIYKLTKKKSPARLSHTSKAPARSEGRGPPVPSPDYEQLRSHTRSTDTYSVVNRTG